MARKLNPDLYAFRWLAEALVERGLTVTKAAGNINRTPSTIYNWLAGCYLTDAITKPNQKDDVADLIAQLLGCETEEVRQQIYMFLVSAGKIATDAEIPNYRSEITAFVEKVKKIRYYDAKTALTPDQRDLILSVLAVLEKI